MYETHHSLFHRWCHTHDYTDHRVYPRDNSYMLPNTKLKDTTRTTHTRLPYLGDFHTQN